MYDILVRISLSGTNILPHSVGSLSFTVREQLPGPRENIMQFNDFRTGEV